jgi:hypothetical protein
VIDVGKSYWDVGEEKGVRVFIFVFISNPTWEGLLYFVFIFSGLKTII